MGRFVHFSAIALGAASCAIVFPVLSHLPVQWALFIGGGGAVVLVLWWLIWATRRWFDWVSLTTAVMFFVGLLLSLSL